jgi:ERCC4-related helicase
MHLEIFDNIKLKKPLREYQKEALEYALSFNTAVCVLPTGTGKTLVGIAWVIELLNKGEVKRILILEPSRFLVEQTYKMYLENTNLSKEDVNLVYGFLSKEERERREIWKRGVAVICTPQTAFNDIHLLEDFDAVIVDECHHTTGRYAYVKLLSDYNFKHRLGLTATLSDKVRNDVISYLSNKIKIWTWEELKKKYPQYRFPDWIGEVYDAELDEEEIDILSKIEKSNLEPLARSFCLRTFTRDGALALMETLNNTKTKLSREFPDEIKDKLTKLRELHKLEVVESVLNEHDFEKCIIFVDRVCVANKIFEKFRNLNPILFLGRLRIGLEKQKEILEEAKKHEHKLIISTSAGEEGIDLPTADLLIIWSNVASPIRFIQRHGRITRPSEKLKVVTFIATPGTPIINSPDYDSLVDGLILAKENGLDIAGFEDEEFVRVLKTKSFRNRIKTLLEPHPLRFEEILENLGYREKGETKVKRWLSILLKEEKEEFRIFYFYRFPYEEIKNKLDEQIEIYKENAKDFYLESKEGFHRFAIDFFSKLKLKDRFYLPFQQIEQIEFEEGFSQYFPSLQSLRVPLSLRYRIEEGRKTKISKGFVIFNGDKFEFADFSFPLHRLNKREFEELSLDKEFEEIIETLYQVIGDKYIHIIFSSSGKYFLPNLYFNGKFNKKALELILRNAFYVLLNIKKLLETYG